jgi:hypothetical protein
MEPHQLYRTAMRHGDATAIARELGICAEVPRRWLRPAAGPANLDTGALSHLERGKFELKAADLVNQETADILLFDLYYAVAVQRAVSRADTREAVVQALAHGFRQSVVAILSDGLSPEDKEAELYRAGGSVTRAILFLEAQRAMREGGLAITPIAPMRRIHTRNWLVRLIARLFIDELPFPCRFRHDWDLGPTLRKCRREGCGKAQAGIPKR